MRIFKFGLIYLGIFIAFGLISKLMGNFDAAQTTAYSIGWSLFWAIESKK